MPDLARTPPKNQILPIDLVSPGFLGLNYAQRGTVLSPAYAVEAKNAVIDGSGRLAARRGLEGTSAEHNTACHTIHEYIKEDGTTERWYAFASHMTNQIDDFSGENVAGVYTWFQNFNGKCLAFGTPDTGAFMVRNGASPWAPVVVSSGTAPTGPIALAAYGRVWATSDSQTIKYSGLLDETDWGSSSAGLIDMSKVWTQGTDVITAIRAFNGALVIFGRRHIVFWTDGRGSDLGLDPTQMYVVDVITGTGAVSQHAIQPVGDTDLLLLSEHGVQSIRRLFNEKSSPVHTLTKYVRPELLLDLRNEDLTKIRSTYSPDLGSYLLLMPTAGRVWVLDQRYRYADKDGEECSVITEWAMPATCLYAFQDGTIQVAYTVPGSLGQSNWVWDYSGAADGGRAIEFRYKSPWLDLGEEVANLLKLLKRVGAVLWVTSATRLSITWGTDFGQSTGSYSTSAVAATGTSEWGDAEFGEAEWGGGVALQIIKVPARDRGQYYQLGVSATLVGEFALQQVELFTKMGRIA